MQAPVYTPVTDFADDERNNAGGRSTIRTDRLDAELDAIEITTDALCANLALIQRDDGKLVDGLVEYWNLSSSAVAALLATKWTARGLWVTARLYAVSDMVDVNGSSYVCAIAHTSGVFATDYAAGRWQIFVGATNAGGVVFAPTATVSAINVQQAIQEVDGDLRAISNPGTSAFYGGL